MTESLESVNARSEGTLPGLLGIEFTHAEPGLMRARLKLRPDHMAANGYLHAGTMVTLADTACGYGTVIALPEGAANFTTVELKSNFLGTLREGELACEAKARHRGGSTQVWDATVTDAATGKVLALFRCTQMILRPKPG